MSAAELVDFACRVCGGPILAVDVVEGYQQHMPDLSQPDPPEIARIENPAKQLVARQRQACAAGRARAVVVRGVIPSRFVVADTEPGELYPCRCGEADEWAHSHGRCPCQGRDDGRLVPPTCCAHIPSATTEEQCVDDGPPASTLEELRQVLIDYELARPRSMQTTLGPSELGTPCTAQMIRKLGPYPVREVSDPAWAPFIGIAVHAEMEKVIAHWNAAIGRERFITEDELHCGDDVIGHGDAYDTDTGTVIDWKVTGTTALNKLARAQRTGKPVPDQVSAEYRVQAHLYGAGHARKGRDVRWVRLVLLARSHDFDQSAEWTEAYDPGIAQAAIDRYVAAKGLVAALDLAHNAELISAIPKTPSSLCGWCPFYRPDQPNDAHGCPGDETRVAQAIERFTEGLITVTPNDVL